MPLTCASVIDVGRSAMLCQNRTVGLSWMQCMAQISPSLESVRRDIGLVRELEVLEHLRLALPEGFEVFHGIDWMSEHGGVDRHGEFDLVVLAPNGNILIVEVKAGDVIERDGALIKRYSRKEHDVGRQVRTQHAAMCSRLDDASLQAYVTTCLVLPDCTVPDSEQGVSMPRDHIIDANDYASLGARIRELLQRGHSRSDRDAIRRFLANEFRVSPDLRVLGDHIRESSRRLADGLATWVPRIHAPSGVVRIRATAGSGKTQLALRLLDDAAQAGLRAIYVCFNRPLADQIARLAPTRTVVASFHELCVDSWRNRHGEPDFAKTGIFDELAAHYLAASRATAARVDLMVIDEGQDFEPSWVSALLPQLKESGCLYLLEDEAQRLYEREAFELADAVEIDCDDNFRSPRAIVGMINALRLSDRPISARSSFMGDLPEFRTYRDERSLKAQTAAAVQVLIDGGITLDEIAVISLRGLANSVLLREGRLGDFELRRFSGRYSADGSPEWTAGDLHADSVFRFKGQSALGVVLTEVDFDSLNDSWRRRLFVGLTRAHLACAVVMSKQAEAAFSSLLASSA